MRVYTLKKSKHILRNAYSRFKRKEKQLTVPERDSHLQDLKDLDLAILDKDRQQADYLAKKIEVWLKKSCPKNLLDHTKELIFALAFALVVATLVRTMWFELYEIPTGSMRPTFKEQDRLIASKTTFGINVPLIAKHFLFEPDLVHNSDVVIFTVENMDVYDPDTLYFYIFPGKRLLIKRLIGKPGDTLYFYGGRVYGIDKEGQDIASLRDAEWMQKIDHVPFITFEGREIEGSKSTEYLFYQSGQEVGRLQVNALGAMKGMVFDGKSFVADNPAALLSPHDHVETYSDLWGFKNYAMARLLTPDEAAKYSNTPLKEIGEGILYLELNHTPNFSTPQPVLARDGFGNVRPLIKPQVTYIPLQEKHISKLFDNLYTARFVVKNGYAGRYSEGGSSVGFDIPMPGVEDGTYEFYYGTAYKISWGGIQTEVPGESPLYNRNLKMAQTLFNLGIDFNLLFAPKAKETFLYPQRYAYFREGSLYLMGGKILDKEDPVLEQFVKNELKRQKDAPIKKPYVAFVDGGAPVRADGSLDTEFIKIFGLKVPEKFYYVLGDNYAMSADSRDFGFVPEDNLRGSPAFIVWPTQDRFGPPKQPYHFFFTLPNIVIWAAFILICIAWYWIDHKRLNKPLFAEQSSPSHR